MNTTLLKSLRLAIIALCSVQVAAAAGFQVDREAQNSVTFISDAPIEDIEGVTSAIDGYVSWRADSLIEGPEYDSSEFYFEVELAGLQTGIGLRDRHLRENYLETDTYPYASLAGKLEEVEFTEDTWSVSISGLFAIHGVERPLSTTCKAVRMGDSFRVFCQFEVHLTEHNIEVPTIDVSEGE